MRPHHSTVVAYLALFVALCGSAAAVSGKVGTREIQKNAVTTGKLRGGAVTSPKIAPGAVGSTDLAAGAVGTAQLAPLAVDAGRLAPGSVSSAKLEDGAVTQGKLAPGAVGTTALGDGAVTAAKVTGPLGLGKSAVAVVDATVAGGAAIPAGTCASENVAVPGAQVGDPVLVLPRPNSTLPFPGTFATARANNIAGVVTVGICNFSQVDIGDIGAAQPVTIAVFR